MSQKTIGHKIISEFTEEDFISAFETVLSHCTYHYDELEISRISQDDERELGYDGVLTSIVPFYIQFKRSAFHKPEFRGQLSDDRTHVGFSNFRGYYSFNLHRYKKTRVHEQHNALYKLSSNSTAAYLAPLFLKKSVLSRYKKYRINYPWNYASALIYERNRPSLLINNIRIFQKTITIPPHRHIADKKPHAYTFSNNGETCFHSEPEHVENYIKPFDVLLNSIIEQLLDLRKSEKQIIRVIIDILPELFDLNWASARFNSIMKSYLLELDLIPDKTRMNVSDFIQNKLLEHDLLFFVEHVLKEEFNIIQYVARLK